MARVTVEDCLDNVDNRFQLVLVSSKRARQIANGKEPMVEWENDKPTVVALREIADGHVTRTILDQKEEVEVEVVEVTAEGEATEASAEASAPAQPLAQPLAQLSDEIIERLLKIPS